MGDKLSGAREDWIPGNTLLGRLNSLSVSLNISHCSSWWAKQSIIGIKGTTSSSIES